MKRIFLSAAIFISTVIPILQPTIAMACPSGSRGQVLQGIGETGPNGCDASGVDNTLKDIVSILSIFVGVLAIIMIIVAGSKYITSGGDANKVTNAKSTLIYALIGIIVAALAQVFAHFVLAQANSNSG